MNADVASYFLTATYDPALTLLSVVIAVFASYIALDLAQRVDTAAINTAWYWLIAASLAMGTGIWSMHFVAMLAFSLPIRLGYDVATTLVSWFAAVSASGVALLIASRSTMSIVQCAVGSVVMGSGICAMHYTGMMAMKMQPAIVWQPMWLALSIVVALLASFAALQLFRWMRSRSRSRRISWQVAASTVMGLAIVGMHFSGMAAAQFPRGSICGAASVENSTWLGAVIGGATLFLLGVILVKSTAETRAQDQLAALNETLKRHNAELVDLNKKLLTAKEQLEQADKLASIGQLAAGVAHEINNPLGFVGSNVTTLGGYVERLFELLAAYEAITSVTDNPSLHALRDRIDLAYLRNDVPALLRDTKDGVERVRRIVQDLKDFSRVDTNGDWQYADLHQCIDSTLNILASEIKSKADVVKEYGNLPEIECLPSQLNQVIMNLVMNAAQAITDERGVISIRTAAEADYVWIEIADTGIGIPEAHMSRIFDPFFTTKPIGKGTGLGLSLSYGIVQKHQGRIEVTSEVSKGTSFRVVLPVCAALHRPAADERAV
ncbi:MAG: histidine kinase [Burkholderiales bacterium]|nr:histidine kinase [Burkholderiales bacterium]